jgi:hypothetical protein
MAQFESWSYYLEMSILFASPTLYNEEFCKGQEFFFLHEIGAQEVIKLFNFH